MFYLHLHQSTDIDVIIWRHFLVCGVTSWCHCTKPFVSHCDATVQKSNNTPLKNWSFVSLCGSIARVLIVTTSYKSLRMEAKCDVTAQILESINMTPNNRIFVSQCSIIIGTLLHIVTSQYNSLESQCDIEVPFLSNNRTPNKWILLHIMATMSASYCDVTVQELGVTL